MVIVTSRQHRPKSQKKGKGDIRRILMLHVHNLFSRVFGLAISTSSGGCIGVCCDWCHSVVCSK